MKASRAILSVFSIFAFQFAVCVSASDAIDTSLKQDAVNLLIAPGQQPPSQKPIHTPAPHTVSSPKHCPTYTPQLKYTPAVLQPGEPPHADGDLPYLSVIGSNKPNSADGRLTHSFPDIRFGYTLNTKKLDAIFSIMKLPSQKVFIKNLDKLGALTGYLNNGNGSYLYLSVAAKFKMVNPKTFSALSEMNHAYGTLKNAGLNNDSCTIKSVIKYAGGSTYGLSDDQLIYLWGTNEHQNFHEIAFSNVDLRVAACATSLCDFAHDKFSLDNKYDNVLTPAFGGCNDGGVWLQGVTTTQLEVTQRFLELVGLEK